MSSVMECFNFTSKLVLLGKVGPTVLNWLFGWKSQLCKAVKQSGWSLNILSAHNSSFCASIVLHQLICCAGLSDVPCHTAQCCKPHLGCSLEVREKAAWFRHADKAELSDMQHPTYKQPLAGTTVSQTVHVSLIHNYRFDVHCINYIYWILVKKCVLRDIFYLCNCSYNSSNRQILFKDMLCC